MEMREIPGFPGYMITKSGDLWSYREVLPKRIRPNWCKGYLHVNVKTAPGRQNVRKRPLHQLVLLAWVGPRPSPAHVGRHRDRDVSNNTADNLIWGTPAQNIEDAIRHGTHVSARNRDNHPCTKLPRAALEIIASDAASSIEGVRCIANQFNVTIAHVARVRRRMHAVPMGV